MAESGVYVGGHIRRERPGTITKLKESGFTYVILFNINVESDGTLKTDHCRTKVFKKADFAISNIYISAYYENNSAWTKNLSWSNNVLSGNFSTL